MTVLWVAIAAAASSIATLLARRLIVDRLWVDVAVKGLRRYLDDGRQHVPSDALVLDVGGGDRPHIRADVVCDRYENSWERGLPLLRDRPLVLADINALPFKDQAFGFVICQHVMEHVSEPDRAVDELQRVAPRGLIRTPSPLAEKLVSRDVHRWYVQNDDGTLVMEQKPTPIFDEEVTMALAGDARFWRYFGSRIYEMETSLFWEGQIPLRVQRAHGDNGDVWSGEPQFHEAAADPGGRQNLRAVLRQRATRLVGGAYRQGLLRRPRRIDWEAILACPACRAEVRIAGEEITCTGCGRVFAYRDGVPVMLLGEELQPAAT